MACGRTYQLTHNGVEQDSQTTGQPLHSSTLKLGPTPFHTDQLPINQPATRQSSLYCTGGTKGVLTRLDTPLVVLNTPD